MRHGPGEGHQEHRRALAGAYRPEGCPGAPGGAGEAYFSAALLRREDPDGGLRRGGHLPGPGQPPGEERAEDDTEKYLSVPVDGHDQAPAGRKPAGAFCRTAFIFRRILQRKALGRYRAVMLDMQWAPDSN